MLMDLRGVHTGTVILDPVDLGNGLIIQRTVEALVRPDGGHQGIKAAPAVQGFPFFQCFVTIGNGGTIGKSQRRSGNAFVVSRSRGIRKKPLDDRSNECEAELCHFGIMFESFSVFIYGKSLLLMFSFIISGDSAASQPPVVWSEDGDVGNEHQLMVPCVFQTGRNRIFMGREKGIRKTQDKLHGELREAFCHKDAPEERKVRNQEILQKPEPVLLVGSPQGKPLIEPVLRDAISFTELLHGKTVCEILAEKAQDKEQTEAGIRDHDIRKDGVAVLTAVTEDAHYAETVACLNPGAEVNQGAVIVVVDVTVTGASAEGTGLKMRLKFCHVGIKKRF